MIGALTGRHALAWLVAANAVGVLLAAELVWPALGDALAPLTYGRWMPLHMNWQLYGWCSLPLAGVLLAWCVDARHPRARVHVSVALGAWSLALVLGGVAWLGGVTSGKLFLDWAGWARGALSVAMVVLWTVCAAHAWWRRGADGQRVADWLRGGFLTMLLFVPGLLYWAAGREVYPSVNPHSGGATGASLLGSTLGIVMIFGLLPVMLRVPVRMDGKPKCHLIGDTLRRSVHEGKSGICHLIGDNLVRGTGWYWWVLAGSYGVFGVIDRGNASHHAWGQIVGLGLLGMWVPLAWIYFRRFEWEASAWRWLGAAFAWWLVLVVTGFLTFLPGLSERLKFTNGLVAHAHLAMAGLVTAVNFVVLRQLAPRAEPRGNFWAWQLACAAMVAVLMVTGWSEAENAGGFFRSEAWSQGGYGARLAAGGVMLGASVRWLAGSGNGPLAGARGYGEKTL
jgi:cytochrome c oxidase cbb3-type subunit I